MKTIFVPDALTARYRAPEDNILGALHKHLYEPESLAVMLRRAGFVVLEVSRVLDQSRKLTVYGLAMPGAGYAGRMDHV